MNSRRTVARCLMTGIALATIVGLVFSGRPRSMTEVLGSARLIAFEATPELARDYCEWDVATEDRSASALARRRSGPPTADARVQSARGALDRASDSSRKPLRFIQDPYPEFSGVFVDTTRNEAVLLDANRFNILVYDRLTNTPASAPRSEPTRTIGGVKAQIQYTSDLYVDPKNGDIYSVNNDTLMALNVFSRQARGNVAPDRHFPAPYGSYGLVVDEEKQEILTTVQHDGAVVAWPKMFQGTDVRPVRLLQGDRTQMADPHGIALDRKNRLIYVTNFGTTRAAVQQKADNRGIPRIPNWPSGSWPAYRNEIVAGSGTFGPPRITVFRADAGGNTAPLRVIQGPRTQLNWPTGIAVDPDRGEIYVANDIGDSVSVFSATVAGDVAPIRVLQGPRTSLSNPLGVFVDTVNHELWVANFGNHRATVYSQTAAGNTAPLRVIRGAPLNEPASEINNPFSISYDPKREEILVPNCVGHPRIAAFPRLADKNAAPVRRIEGQKTLLNRTVHSVFYDDVHDELVVNQNIAQGVMTFRGSANGEEPPIRVISGPKVQLVDPNSVAVDPIHNEIFVVNTTVNDRVLVYDRTANGNVAPKRILMGPDTMLGASQVAVDPVRNLLIVAGNVRGQGMRILLFDREAEGNAKPKGMIGGPKSGLTGVGGNGFRVYVPTGKIVVNVAARGENSQGGDFTGVWSLDDRGDVPPQWTVGRGMLQQSRGLALDPKSKTVMIADKQLQGVLTYHLPEMFEDSPRTQTAQR